MSHDHTHEISVEHMMLNAAKAEISMLHLREVISKKALLKLLWNVGDSVTVELDPTNPSEVLVDDENDDNPLTSVTITRLEGDVLDLSH